MKTSGRPPSHAAEHISFLQPVALSDIVESAAGIVGEGSIDVRPGPEFAVPTVGVSDGRQPAPATLCFVDRVPANDAVEQLQRSLVITNPEIASHLEGCALVVVPDARALFIDLLVRLGATPGFSCFTSIVDVAPGIHLTADIHRTAIIEPGVCIGPDTSVAAGCVVKRGTAIGRGVSIRENTVVGGRGFALYKARDGRIMRMPDLAGVIIEDGVEIGTSCSLPRGVLTSTVVGRDSVIGNLCNLGHGVKIGAGVWISVGTLIGGNASIGEGSTFGLGAAVRDNVRVGRKCSIGMGSVVMRDLSDGSAVLGNPARRLPHVGAGPER